MSEIVRVLKWLTDKLTGDTTLLALVSGVFYNFAPSGTAYPFVIMKQLRVEDVSVVNGVRVMVSGDWLVEAVGIGNDLMSLQPIADRIDALLHRASGAVTGGGEVFASVRVEPFELVEDYEAVGEVYAHLGGVYRIWAK